MNKHKIYVCHHLGYADRLKNLPSSYEYELVTNGSNIPFPNSLSVKHYAIMGRGEDAIVVEDDVILPENFPFDLMIEEAKKEQIDVVFFGGVSNSVEEQWGMKMTPDETSADKFVYHKLGYTTRCTHGYYITKEACKKILSEGIDISLPFDHAFNGHILRLGLKVGWTYPCVYQMTAENLNGKTYMEHFYHLTEGEDWFTYPTLYAQIVKIAPNKAHFVEVGVWKGRSAAFLAVEIINSGKKITLDLVDTWQGSEEHLPLQYDLFEVFKKNIEPVLPYVNIKRIDSLSAASTYEDKSLDFVFIDAAHDYESVKADIQAWLPKVKLGGYLAGHDYPAWEGVTRAVNELIGENNIESAESCWLYPVK
jgi:hypothetical protein